MSKQSLPHFILHVHDKDGRVSIATMIADYAALMNEIRALMSEQFVSFSSIHVYRVVATATVSLSLDWVAQEMHD